MKRTGKSVLKALSDPHRLWTALEERQCFNWMPDSTFLKLKYYCRMGKRLDLEHPKTYNEKLQWLKLHDRRPEYIGMTDKLMVKELVAEKIGAEYVIPTIGVWDRADRIAFDALPEQFVLKCNHDSGSTVICRDRERFSEKNAVKKLRRSLKRNGFWYGREWPYRQIRPKIIAEPYVEDAETGELRDYKFFCFDGEPKAVLIASGRQREDAETTFDFFDMEFQHLDFHNGHPWAESMPEKPTGFEEMKTIAKALSAGLPHVRVDLYEANGRLFFGELTFFHWSGFCPFEPASWDVVFGEWLHLPLTSGGHAHSGSDFDRQIER